LFAYDKFFQRPLIKEIIEEDRMNLLVYSHIEETIILWKKW
jgi:hypothetical protein